MITATTTLEPIELTHAERLLLLRALETMREESERSERELIKLAVDRPAQSKALREYVISRFETADAVAQETKDLFERLSHLAVAPAKPSTATQTSNRIYLDEQEEFNGYEQAPAQSGEALRGASGIDATDADTADDNAGFYI